MNPAIGTRQAFYHPTEVRLWERVTGLKVSAMPEKEGDSVAILQDGVEVGRLVLEQSGKPFQVCAVTYWNGEGGE